MGLAIDSPDSNGMDGSIGGPPAHRVVDPADRHPPVSGRRRRWSVSVDATNPLIALTRSTTFDEATDTETTERSTTFAEQLHPTVRVMAHLFF
jgi:hypothetical protein